MEKYIKAYKAYLYSKYAVRGILGVIIWQEIKTTVFS